MLTHRVFVYGTLQVPDVVQRIVGRALQGTPAVLENYARFRLQERVYPAIAARTGSNVDGVVYSGVTTPELALLDHYEGSLYERQEHLVTLKDERLTAFTYVLRTEYSHLARAEDWDLETFRLQHLPAYLEYIGVMARAPLV